MLVSLRCLANYINELDPFDDNLVGLFEDLGLEVKRIQRQPDDVIYTLELLANRGDLRSYVGIARELNARTSWPLAPLSLASVELNSTTGPAVSIETSLCLGYSLSLFERNTSGEDLRPDFGFGALMLEVAGVNRINTPVDVSNLVTIELGQPLHAFDADKIEGSIKVRESKLGERAHLLFSDEAIVLPEGSLVIADDVQVLAIAGVIGCEGAKPTSSTKRVLLESATFDPVSVRMTAKALGLQTSASMRFERGGDPSLLSLALARAAALLNERGWSHRGTGSAREWDEQRSVLSFDPKRFARVIGTSLRDDEMATSLEALSFQVERNLSGPWRVIVPPHRQWDVVDENDLYEEVCRNIGYNALQKTFPTIDPPHLRSNEVISARSNVEHVLLGSGFFEVFTEGFYSDDHARRLGVAEDYPRAEHLRVLDGHERAYSLMKNTNVAHALDLIRSNVASRNFDVKAFEWSRTFHPDSAAENEKCSERKVLWLVASGDAMSRAWKRPAWEVDLYWLMGVLGNILTARGIEHSFRQTETSDAHDYPVTSSLLHPTRKANIVSGGATIGVVGEIHPTIVKEFGIKRLRPCFAELLEVPLQVQAATPSYTPPARIQVVTRDVSFVVPHGLPTAEICNELMASSEAAADVHVIDVFSPAENASATAITFRITFDPVRLERTALTSEYLSAEMNKASGLVANRFAAQGLRQR